MPCKADVFLSMCRKWLDTVGSPFGDGAVGRGGLGTQRPPLITDSRVLLDRYEQHTRNCSKCMRALRVIEGVRTLCAVTAALSWGAFLQAAAGFINSRNIALAAGATPSLLPSKPVALVGLICFAITFLWKILGDIRQQFYYVPYVHAEK